MANLTTRTGKGSALTHDEMDANWAEIETRTKSGWYDLVQPVSTAGVPPANAPAATTFGPSGLREEYAFDIGDYVFCAPMHINHDIKPGGKAYAHVHWSTSGGNTATVKWEMQISRALGHNQASFGAAVSVFVEQAAHTDAWRHMVSEVSLSDALTLTEPDELILVTLRRVTNGGTNNAATVFGLLVDFHYERDRDATINKAPNFYV